MTINLTIPDIQELKPRITVFGVGGAGGNAVNNMIASGLDGVDFVVANTDAQALALSSAQRIIQLGVSVTEGLGAGSHPEVGRAAAEESFDEINDHLSGSHMVFITAGMGGGTGTGAAPVIARAAREQGILTVGVVTKPFTFEGNRRARLAEDGIDELHRHVDTLIVIPNQNLFRVANEKTTFADAFKMADQVLYSGVACITDLMVLTLYEVDEAASRIREEVDPDANIILGATYDANMNGSIRVSVVATGTDATMVQALEPMKANHTRAPLEVRRAPVEQQPQAQLSGPELESQVEQAVAEAITRHEPLRPVSHADDEGVTVEPYIPAATHSHSLDEVSRAPEAPVPSVYVPSNAERPDGQRRMPRTEELPAVARRTLAAQEKHEAEPRNARALFKRLASNVGINLGAPEARGHDESNYSEADDAAARSAIEAGAPRVSHAPAATEGAHGSLDAHGRPVTPAAQKEHIEIPAFLRKHG